MRLLGLGVRYCNMRLDDVGGVTVVSWGRTVRREQAGSVDGVVVKRCGMIVGTYGSNRGGRVYSRERISR